MVDEILIVMCATVMVMQIVKLRMHLRMDALVTNTLGKMDDVLTAQARLQGVYEAISHWQAAQATDVVKQTVEKGVERIEAKLASQPPSDPALKARP